MIFFPLATVYAIFAPFCRDECPNIVQLTRLPLFFSSVGYKQLLFYFSVLTCFQVYACYLVFQLFSHAELYDDSKLPASRQYDPSIRRRLHLREKHEVVAMSTAVDQSTNGNATSSDVQPAADAESGPAGDEDVEHHEPGLDLSVTFVLLAIVTVVSVAWFCSWQGSAPNRPQQLVAVTAEFLVDAIDGLTTSGHISKEFVGIILLPIVGNAAEHVTAVTVSVKDKLTLSIGVAVGSSIVRHIRLDPHYVGLLTLPPQQIALFVIPFIVTLGWMIGKPLTLLFDPFESVVLFFAVLVVNYVVQDGKSNWLEGMILMCACAMCIRPPPMPDVRSRPVHHLRRRVLVLPRHRPHGRRPAVHVKRCAPVYLPRTHDAPAALHLAYLSFQPQASA
jgi:Ca2+/H+ antiporter